MTEHDRVGEEPFAAALMMGGWINAGRAWLDIAGRCSGRMMEFAGERLEADLALCRRLAECRDLASMSEAQGEWLRTAIEDYRRELQATADAVWSGLRQAGDSPSVSAAGAGGPTAEATARPRERRAA